MNGATGSEVPSDLARVLARLDTTTPHPARRYNYWLGGKDNFAVDRESGDKIAEFMPTIRLAVLENRRFLARAVRFMVGAGVRQFLDIGTGIPAPGHPHEIAQQMDPTCRVVYVDNDPVVLAHSRALLNSSAEGTTAYVEADVRDADRIVADPTVRSVLDFSQPVGLLMIALMHFVEDERAYPAVAALTDPLPAGSFLAMSHGTQDFAAPEQIERDRAEAASGRHGLIVPRSSEQIGRFFDGMELVEPGITAVAHWRAEAEPQPRPTARDVACYAAVAKIR